MKHLSHIRLWRACLNVLPFVTIWLSLEGGTEP